MFAGFTDDHAQEEVLWKALWAEGLATYASMKPNPPASMQDARFVPQDLVMRSQPLHTQVVRGLLPEFDRIAPALLSWVLHRLAGGRAYGREIFTP